MPIISVGYPAIQIEVPNKERALCFHKELSDLLNKLRSSIIESKEVTISPHAIKGLLEDFSKILDKQVIEFMDRDIKQYCTEQKINPDKISKKEALAYYQKYFSKAPRNGEKGFRSYMEKTHPNLFAINTTLCTHFFKNINQTFLRIKNDSEILQAGFFKDLKTPIQLTQMKSTGSDFHLGGKQVFILNFTDSTGESRKIVYKPTCLQADALIVGDVRKLSQLDERFKNIRSMMEIFNDGLEKRRQVTLPTYLIIPREDKSGDSKSFDIHNQYGYIEFITHYPWRTPNYDAALEAKIKDLNPADREHFIKFELDPFYARQSADILREAAEVKECNFITDKPEVVKQYSVDCGILAMLMYATGLVDSHYGNLIIHNGRPYLIDTEACLTPRNFDMETTSCFDPYSGSMSRFSICTEDGGTCLFDITGKQSASARHAEKNLLFFREGDKIQACQPSYKDWISGYQVGLDIVSQDKAVLAWFDQDIVKNMPVRFLPFQTANFKRVLDVLHAADFSKATFQEISRQTMQAEFKRYQRDIAKYVKAGDLQMDKPLPYAAIYNADSTYEEYLSQSIPYFYVQGTSLKYSNNQVVTIPENWVELQQLADSSQKYDGSQFFSEPLHQFIRKRVEALANEYGLKTTLTTTATDEKEVKLDTSLRQTLLKMVEKFQHSLDIPAKETDNNFAIVSLTKAAPSKDLTELPKPTKSFFNFIRW